jgi:hypothetical protein
VTTTIGAANQLTPDQKTQIGGAREVLGAKTGYDPAEMAGRIGRLEWHLGELLSLVEHLTAAPAAGPNGHSSG